MTARFLPWICLFGCSPAEPGAPAPKTADLSVPAMREAGSAAPPPKKAPRQDRPPEERSYEEALAMAHDAGPMVVDETDMTDSELSAPMRHTTWIAGCGAPNAMKLTVKVAVQGGRAVGVTVTTSPEDENVARCVDSHIRRELTWPVKKKLDSFTVTY